MIAANVNRAALYQACQIFLSDSPETITALEIGVLRGDNAEDLLEILSPERLYLLDTWSAETLCSALYSRRAHRPWLRSPSSLSNYFGGNIADQRTFDKLYDQVKQRFLKRGGVEVVKGSSKNWGSLLPRHKINYVYLDGSHQYEDVLDDLIAINDNAAAQAIVQLNDCFVSHQSHAQNIGVIEAVSRFIKLFQWSPVCLATGSNDVVISRGFHDMKERFCQILDSSNIRYISVPSALLGSVYLNEHGSLFFD